MFGVGGMSEDLIELCDNVTCYTGVMMSCVSYKAVSMPDSQCQRLSQKSCWTSGPTKFFKKLYAPMKSCRPKKNLVLLITNSLIGNTQFVLFTQ